MARANKQGTREGFRLNRRLVTFLFCVLLSVFFWLLMALSRNYTITVSFPVSYSNFPKDKLIANRLPANIDLELFSSGFNLMIYQIRQQKETVFVDLRDARPLHSQDHYFMLCNEHIDKITSQFDPEIKVLQVRPDTIYIDFSKKSMRKLPVKPVLEVTYAEQYQQTDSTIVEPRFVNVSGPAEVLDKMEFVETVPATLKNVSSPVALRMEIARSNEFRQLEYEPSSVEVKVNVTKFTEAILELPIDVINLPKGYSLKTFPDKVSVRYQVAFDNYGKINALDFKAVVDYNKIEAGSNKLKVQLVTVPREVRSVKLSTEKVEYIIGK
ncbi:MAG: YbbR-like domain-containing protein [Bacteroidia bacterium]